ncbi:polyprenol monophosphomannose synthase [Ohtaekwangia koreensis]|uniref:Dolichol-phosphate mannosyltransferase n=1 Tax=Ohtaekwangia koreensis TaxID=688867 RepID=A0A1T5JB63_9BACT|nr:polyprenol monophosphomannose synthase [Ohtaekwangia koreensis]SKC48767.1 dolichol-phosphate mannosyltransferase [Ohtaekwangia koreensis]
MSNAIVIIPTYKERENIRSIIDTVFSLPKEFHILIVDDNSPDGTAQIVEELQEDYNTPGNKKLHLLKRPGKLGLGTAYITGFKFALEKGYDYILEMDADFSHDPKDLVHLYLSCAEFGSDVSIGSRYATGVNVVNWPMGRVLLSYFASSYVRLITSIPVHDTTAGFVCYSRKVLETIALDQIKFVGYAFQIEMKFIAWKFGFTLKEVPIIFTDRTRGESKMSPGIFKEAFFGVLQMTIQSWFKKYIPAQS